MIDTSWPLDLEYARFAETNGLPPEIPPRDPLLAGALARVAEIVIGWERAAGHLPESWKAPRLVFVPRRETGSGWQEGGVCYTALNDSRFITLSDAVFDLGPGAIELLLHELRHSYPDSLASSELEADAYAARHELPALQAINAELEAAIAEREVRPEHAAIVVTPSVRSGCLVPGDIGRW